ncbi:MAG: hypothetical protein ACYCZF_04450 [Anaerolineae bacterium]
MNDIQKSYDMAEAARKDKKYSKASELFLSLWEQNATSVVGWRLVFCLRKLGKIKEAEVVAQEALRKFPGDRNIKSELSWIIYDKEIKPAKEEGDLKRIIHFANEMLVLNSDVLPLVIVAQAVIKVAKAQDKWPVVLEWTGKLKPEMLSPEPMLFNGKQGMSSREIWYIGRSRAMLELGRFSEARELAQQGMKEFPRKPFLARIAALAAASMGQIDVAIEELTKLLSNPIAGWYIKADLAELEYQRGNYPIAFNFMCEALSGWQDVKFKVSDIVLLARIAQKLGRLDVAITHIAFAKAIRIENNWPIPKDLQVFEQEVHKAIVSSGGIVKLLPTDLTSLKAICNSFWKEDEHKEILQADAKHGKVIHIQTEQTESEQREANPNTQEVLTGVLSKVYPNSSYAFIERDDGGGGVFVFIKDIPSAGLVTGAHLEFTLKQGFSQKKKEKAIQAADVSLLKF